MNFASRVAELVLESATLQEFHREFLSIATPLLGVDAACAGTQRLEHDGSDISTNMDLPHELLSNIASGSEGIGDTEARLMLTGRFRRMDEVFSSKRREQMSLWCDYLRPRDLEQLIFRVWTSPGAVHMYAFCISRRRNLDRFSAHAMPSLDSVASILEIGERLFGGARIPCNAAVSREVTREFRLTGGEHQAVAIMSRGLTNAEIANVLGLSVHTVRNRLASCFRKLGVSTRTEALFILNQAMNVGEGSESTTPLRVFRQVMRSARSRSHDASRRRG